MGSLGWHGGGENCEVICNAFDCVRLTDFECLSFLFAMARGCFGRFILEKDRNALWPFLVCSQCEGQGFQCQHQVLQRLKLQVNK